MDANKHYDYFSSKGGSSLTSGQAEVPTAQQHIGLLWNFTGHPEALAEESQKVNEMLNLFQHLKKIPPTLTLPPSLRSGNRVAQLVPRWLPLFLKGGREELVSEAHSKFLVPYCLSNLVSSKKAAFTLAEVLITLGIIGVVAAMTIPTLISNYNEKQTVTKLKKVYSTLNQAYTMATIENDVGTKWETASMPETTQTDILTFEKFEPYLKVTEKCLDAEGCFANAMYTTLSGKNHYNFYTETRHAKFVLSDGTSVLFYNYGNTYKTKSTKYGFPADNPVFGAIVIDINGTKGPNVNGKDTFSFIFTNNGIKPNGMPDRLYISQDEEGNDIRVEDPMTNCNRKDCKQYCEACTAWVIYNENMDYLHCDDLSWDGKHSCD